MSSKKIFSFKSLINPKAQPVSSTFELNFHPILSVCENKNSALLFKYPLKYMYENKSFCLLYELSTCVIFAFLMSSTWKWKFSRIVKWRFVSLKDLWIEEKQQNIFSSMCSDLEVWTVSWKTEISAKSLWKVHSNPCLSIKGSNFSPLNHGKFWHFDVEKSEH